MKLRNFLSIFLSLFLLSGAAFAAVTSLDNTFVANDQYAADFYSKLNRNFTQVLTGGVNNINSANILDDSLMEADMNDEINPRVRTYEGASCSDFVYTGLLPQTTSGTLTGNITAGTGYPLGYRVNKASNTSHTWTASKWTWTDIDINGDFHYTETAFGAAAPAVYANSMRLARVSSDTTEVNNVLDLRNTNCANTPFSNFADDTGESTLSDIFTYGDGGVIQGLNLVSYDNTNVTIKAGSAYINGEYRTLVSDLNVPNDTTGSSTAGTSGLDAGSVAADTVYYLYGTADVEGTKPVVGILSTNPGAPAGPTNYRKLGEATTDASKHFASGDVVSINYTGKIRQIKSKKTNAVISVGNNVISPDGVVPTSSMGTEILSMVFTPVNANNILKFEFYAGYGIDQETATAALFKSGDGNALCAKVGNPKIGSNDRYGEITLVHYMQAGTTAANTYSIRMGQTAASASDFPIVNGTSTVGGGTPQFGTSTTNRAYAYFTITEYEL